MTAQDIIERLARKRTVEQIVERVAGRHSANDRADLSQYIYLALLSYDPAVIEQAWAEDPRQLSFIIARIATNQVYQHNTSWQRDCLSFLRRAQPLTDYADDTE